MKSNINLKILAYPSTVIFLFLFLIPFSLALNLNVSNESIQTQQSLNQAQTDIYTMMSKGIGTLRVNETYQEALQLYSAQLALQEGGKQANYSLIIQDVSKISSIKNTALQAYDELEVFKKNYENAEKEVNLYDMKDQYDQIIASFNEERFEDTLVLINKGYDKISEIQSSNTAINAIYSATSKTIKSFFVENWIRIIIIVLIVLILFLIFRNTLRKLNMRIKLNNLIMQKKAINDLIKKLQFAYFKSRKISEAEYKTKLNFYEDFIRDIERQIMVVKEEMFKRDKKAVKKLKARI